MIVGRALAVITGAVSSAVVGPVLCTEIVARGKVVIGGVESLALRGRTGGLRIGEGSVAVVVCCPANSSHRDYEQRRH